jgi:hypothetical protein
MIRSIVVENLRGIKKCVIDDLRDVNIFIGRNGAGKSTILEAIYIASAFANKHDVLRNVYKFDYVVQRRGGRGNWNSFRDTLWFLKDVDEKIIIELKFSTGNTLRFTLINDVMPPPPLHVWPILLEVPRKVIYPYEEGVAYIGRDSGDQLAVWNPAHGVIESSLDKRFYESIESELEYLKNGVFLDEKLPIHIIESVVWRKVLDKRLDKPILELIREEYEPEAEGIGFKPSGEGFTLALMLPNTSIEVDFLGDGAKIALLYAAILSLLKETGVLIEDLENHQHPGGLVTLMRFVLRLAKERKLQLFITTHSIELINIVKKLAEDVGLGMRVYYLERDRSTGIVDVRAMESTDIEILQKLGLDPRLLHIL